MKASTIWLFSVFNVVATLCVAQSSNNVERLATLKFLHGNWQVDKSQLVAATILPDGKTKNHNETSKGYSSQIVSFANNGKLTEYGDFMGRKYSRKYLDSIGKYQIMNGIYSLQDSVIALKATSEGVKPAVLYFYPVAAGDKLLLKMDRDLIIRNEIFKDNPEYLKLLAYANMTLVLSRVKGGIYKTEKKDSAYDDPVESDKPNY